MRNRIGIFGNLAGLLAALTLVFTSVAVHAQGREEARLLTASQVLNDALGSPDQFVPTRLLERAYGIAVIPDVTKIAFFFGGRRGNGVLVARDPNGHFSDPIFVNLTGGSFGFQWGVTSTDVILVFTTKRSIDRIASGQLTLGADASVAAGPVGRSASAGTDPTLSAEVYSYSRSRGLFAGVALDGSALTIDNNADARFYDKGVVNAYDIISGTVRTNSDIARRFLDTVAAAPARAAAPPAAPARGSTAPPPPPRPPAGAAHRPSRCLIRSRARNRSRIESRIRAAGRCADPPRSCGELRGQLRYWLGLVLQRLIGRRRTATRLDPRADPLDTHRSHQRTPGEHAVPDPDDRAPPRPAARTRPSTSRCPIRMPPRLLTGMPGVRQIILFPHKGRGSVAGTCARCASCAPRSMTWPSIPRPSHQRPAACCR